MSWKAHVKRSCQKPPTSTSFKEEANAATVLLRISQQVYLR
jgi:hypothetical protein